MTTEDTKQDVTEEANLDRLNENLAKLERLSERLISALAHKRKVDPDLQAPSQDVFMKASSAYMSEMMQHPSRLFEQQVTYWGKTLKHFIESQEALATGKLIAPPDNTPDDPRFTNELWRTHPYFNYIKQQYLMSAQAIQDAVKNIEGLEERDRKRITYFSNQIIDMMAPTNFLGTNPEALARAVETEGASLVQGLENLVRDFEANNGELLVTLADREAFKVGENLATTSGEVVFRNRMFELIQYAPTTETVHATPLLIFPPWINKFYILDLKPKNSLIKWIVDQGFTLFVVSWVNPDESYADVGMDTYAEEGFLTAIEEVKKITGEDKVNAVGYCIAGTTLSLVLGLLNKRGDKSVRSATFFTALTDFSDQGDVGVFLANDFVDGIEREVMRSGKLDSFYMTRTFSYLRANDLIYRPAIRSYMMGEAPPAFDLLYWNGDGTNLPARMAIEYLRGLCQDNGLAKGTFRICGETPTLRDVKVPVCAIACETDHIAAWRSSFNGIRQMGSRDKTFILSESGHVAGVVNPPSKKKYGHYTNDAKMEDAESWKAEAEFHEGSWWPRWGEWLKRRSGKQVPARIPGDAGHPSLGKAPGTYVLSK
ncbi:MULTISPECIES: PHA/PHB synthase family protein [Actibacterium]|uniref:Polyhydroxyalkanoate synthase n=1 Tax=Actibacterium naphthalenivorans TaxID=1614693 RepID=A0A840CID2_9RHOB|nr:MULTISPECIES: class I poly(R)-hydroxyalkanoic acid synthase [Actibacterium]ALG90805.1 poly(R)-hydroxyalkanoic acid synthase [Actibacterium sp. EMB200-NS6]MBB4022979.1 polyhydroxyalkanoate synthase [Actibacterium naphthalenivorans]